MKASFTLTNQSSVKKPVTFSILNDQFNLNGLELSKKDVALILELQGHDVDHSQDSSKFYFNALTSFSRLSPEDFYEVFDNFVCWDTATKDRYRELVPIVQLRLSPPSLN